MTKTAGLLCAALLTLSAAQVSNAGAASLQPIGTFAQPIYVTSDPGNPNRLFVVEREGRIDLVREGTVTTFADLSSLVSCCEGERGLLSIALAPDFDSTGRFYVDYTGREKPGEIHVAEMRAVGSEASLSTWRNVLTISHPGASNHNGGQLQFGPDGLLYVSTGDGGGGNDEFHNAQNLGSLLGKILRIDPRQSGGQPYTVPAGNPFPEAPGDAKAIWSYGLRNPFRFSFDRLGGAMVIGDVGQDAREEVDYAPQPGLGVKANYGWNCREGLVAGPGDDLPPGECATTSFVEPVFDYPHIGGGCGGAIIGGYVARDESVPGLYGRYVYGDLCTGEIRSLDLSNPFGSDRSEGLDLTNLNSFGEDSCGRLYAVSGNGAVNRIAGSTPASCAAPGPPPHRLAFVGLRPAHGKVERRRRVQITAWASPCQGRRGQRVRLLRGSRPIAAKGLSVACTAQFLVRIDRPTSFRATMAEDSTYAAAISRPVRVRIQHHRHRRH